MMRIRPLILSFSLLAFAGATYAADEKKESAGTAAKPAMSQSDNKSSAGTSAGASTTPKSDSATAVSAKKLIGTDVVDAQGKDMGEIKELVLDLHNGRVHAAVIEFGGFLGIGDKQYAFPVSEFKPAKDKNKLTLNVDKDKLKNEKGFEKDKWPAMGDKYWNDMGGKSAAGATQPSGQKVNLHRASKLMGQDVQDKGGQQVGEIRDVMLSDDRSKIEHIVIDVKGAGDARIEPKELSLGTGDKLMVNLSADELKGQAGKRDKQAQSGAKPSSSAASAGASGGAAAGSSVKKDDDKPATSDTKSSASSAAAGASAGKKSFSELDKDNDGMLSQLEAAGDAHAKSNFEKLDKNNDMKLSREEWQAGEGAAAGATGSAGASGSAAAKSGSAGAAGKPEQPKSK